MAGDAAWRPARLLEETDGSEVGPGRFALDLETDSLTAQHFGYRNNIYISMIIAGFTATMLQVLS